MDTWERQRHEMERHGVRNKEKGILFSGVFIHERKKGAKEKNGT